MQKSAHSRARIGGSSTVPSCVCSNVDLLHVRVNHFAAICDDIRLTCRSFIPSGGRPKRSTSDTPESIPMQLGGRRRSIEAESVNNDVDHIAYDCL